MGSEFSRPPRAPARQAAISIAAAATAGLLLVAFMGTVVQESSRILPSDRSWAVALGIVVAVAVSFLYHPWTPPLGAVLVLASGWLLSQTRDGIVVIVLASVTGAGAALVVAVGLRHVGRAGRPAVAVGLTAALVWASAAFWVGANSATVQWFGSEVSHGSRQRQQVALTFDDGPNATATSGVSDVLDQFGVKATFFTVGKAVDARPDISRALVADGQLLGNHSYAHDSYRWLDPRYPELSRAERAIDRDTGVCPAFYRPPHGQHTPLLADVVHRHGMTMVTWDDSTDDWDTSDAAVVARRVLQSARAGSIIDLHDGLDGHVDVDRTVVVRALPAILEGLHSRGLQVVRLDVLLGRPGYLNRCGG